MFCGGGASYGCMGTELLTETFCRLRQRLHDVAGRMLRDEMEAEDAVQDVFCNLWTCDSPESSDEARYRLFAVLKNVCINKLRRRRVFVDVNETNVDAAVSPPEPDAGRLRSELMRRLPRSQREVFTLAVYEEMEYDEIAESLGMSIEAVRTNMCRARKTLRELYKNLNL